MKDYKKGSHTVWDCKYHLVWITKYRYPVLVGDVGERVRQLLREIAQSLEMTIYAGAINREHVHMLVEHPAERVGVARGAVPEGQELDQASAGVLELAETILGPAPVGPRVLGGIERECHRRSMEEVHRGAEARDTRRQLQDRLSRRPGRSTLTGLSRNQNPSPLGEGSSVRT